MSEIRLNTLSRLSDLLNETSIKTCKVILSTMVDTPTAVLLVSPEVFQQMHNSLKQIGLYKDVEVKSYYINK